MLHITPTFHTDDSRSPYDTVTWSLRTAEIKDHLGKSFFHQNEVEAPASWSDMAVNIAASKYFYGVSGTSERESSVRAMIHRVCSTIEDWGVADGYFGVADGNVFYKELSYLCLNQYASFNSPVWFNVGLWHQYGYGKTGTAGNWWYNSKTDQAEYQDNQYKRPQCSACFIQSVEDSMPSIMHLAVSEAMLFKFGSGSGTNLSPIRSYRESLSGGGTPSGPLSFLKIYDQVANVVKSGGKTRRAAKINILHDWHGDIEEFIDAKSIEERKAWALIEQGYDGSFGGDAYGSVMYQNENLSVRISDEFMHAATDEGHTGEWWTRSVTTGKPIEKKNARNLFRKMAEGAWLCGDPGVQFDSTIQKWNTCKASGRIEATNPCAEFHFLDNTACNLASLNLMKFVKSDGSFDVDMFKAAVRIVLIAQDILVDNASYPTKEIAERSHVFRPLGLGYANLGALIMSRGLPYDSHTSRELAGAITALMTGHAYEVSAEIAQVKGAFSAYAINRASVIEVIDKHCEACSQALHHSAGVVPILDAAYSCWKKVKCLCDEQGFRNSQVTLLAPTGTISFLLDCATTGIEPEIALTRYKSLAGGGSIKVINSVVPQTLKTLGYSSMDIESIMSHLESTGTIENAPRLKEEDWAVFDCAMRSPSGKRSIEYKAHVLMMSAVQPFLSGAISKTVNMPTDATVIDIENTYLLAWKRGLKCIAVYRDGSKRSQPVNIKMASPLEISTVDRLRLEIETLKGKINTPRRKKMPQTRQSVTHKFAISGHEGYLTVGLFPDGKPGELFITMSKEGSTVGGLMDCIGTLTSMALQYGVPVESLINKFSHVRFEPSGWTGDSQIKSASSIIDYVFRWMEMQFPQKEEVKEKIKKEAPPASSAHEMTTDAPPCSNCGQITVRNGSCHKCLNCGESNGCS